MLATLVLTGSCAQQKRRDFEALPPNEQITSLYGAREGLLKQQMVLERKLDEARAQRALKARGKEIKEQANQKVQDVQR